MVEARLTGKMKRSAGLEGQDVRQWQVNIVNIRIYTCVKCHNKYYYVQLICLIETEKNLETTLLIYYDNIFFHFS